MSVNVEQGARYVITNKKAQTALDLSGTDNRSVIGWDRHGGINQQWEAIRVDNGWQLKNAGNGKYLNLDRAAQDGVSVVGSDQGFTWELVADKEDSNGVRIQVPNSYQTVDLSDHGNPAPGTPVTTWGRWNGTNQVWFFERV